MSSPTSLSTLDGPRTAPAFSYANLTGRGPGRLVRGLRPLLPGVARVWDQVAPYAAAWRTHNLETIDRPGRRWIVLGDSMSQGIGATAHDTGWVGQLSARLTRHGHPLNVLNLSATGARTADVVHQQLDALDSIGRRHDDVVTVLVGSNDLSRRTHRARLADTFAELLDRLPRGSIVATLPQPVGAARHANTRLARAAAAGTVSTVTMRAEGPSTWRGNLSSDHVHPNVQGYAAIAAAFETPITALLTGPDRTRPPGSAV